MSANTLSPINVSQRISSVRDLLFQTDSASNCAAVLVTSAVNIRWLTGFTGSAGMVLVSADPASPSYLITDGRYIS